MQRPIRRSPSRLARIRLRPLLAALAALLVLSSCSQIKEQAGDVVEHAIEDAVTGLDLTDGVPEDFPTEAVPIVDGPTRGATKTNSDGVVKSVVLVSAEDSGGQAQELLTEAGLQVDHKVSAEAGRLVQLSGDGHDVTLIASGSEVVYVVTES